MDKLLDIKDFQQYSNVSETDRLLFVKGATGTDASISFSLFISIIEGKIKPEIINGEWYIGGVATGINAATTPQLRYGATGIEYRYTDTDEWATLITLNTLQQPAVDIANELKEHPSKVSENYTWLVWDAVSKQYIDTKISARGRSPIIRDGIWWVWSEVDNDYVSTGQAVNSDFVLTKEAVEGVFVGNVTGHHHLEYTVPTLDNAPSETTLTWKDAEDNVYMFYVGQFCRVADASQDNGYKFYQLYDIKNGKALWDEISGNGSGVGKVYPNTVNGEIFNDYENNIAFGKNAHAEGQETNATGPRAHAEGYLTKVFAADAHAEGRETWCLGAQGHAEGFYSITYGANSHVEGSAFDTDYAESPSTKAILATKDEEFIRTLLDNGDYFYVSDKAIIISEKLFEDFIVHASFGERSHVEGTNNACFDNSSHVEGFGNQCGNMITGKGYALTHNANHIEGKDNYIGGTLEYTYSIHIEGNNNEFRGKYDYPTHAVHIEGQYNSIPLLTEGTSSCNGAHLGGEYSKIIGGRSTFAHGYHLSVKNNYETSFGKYNASEVDGKSVLFSYGIGTSDADRKNAISVLSDGSVSIPNLTGVTGVDDKLKELENRLNEVLMALQDSITGIYNKLSTGDITSLVFVLNDALIITNRIDANVEGTDLVINDEMFIFANGDLSYSSDIGYLTGAVNNNGNLIFTKSIK